MVGRSFRNANQPPLDESAPGWDAITARVESFYPTKLGTSRSGWDQRGTVL